MADSRDVVEMSQPDPSVRSFEGNWSEYAWRWEVPMVGIGDL
jgi:hypothetical protein